MTPARGDRARRSQDSSASPRDHPAFVLSRGTRSSPRSWTAPRRASARHRRRRPARARRRDVTRRAPRRRSRSSSRPTAGGASCFGRPRSSRCAASPGRERRCRRSAPTSIRSSSPAFCSHRSTSDALARALPRRGRGHRSVVLAELPDPRSSASRPRHRRRRRRDDRDRRTRPSSAVVGAPRGAARGTASTSCSSRRSSASARSAAGECRIVRRPDRRVAERQARHSVLLALARGRERALAWATSCSATSTTSARARSGRPTRGEGALAGRSAARGARAEGRDRDPRASRRRCTTLVAERAGAFVGVARAAAGHGLARAFALPPRRRPRGRASARSSRRARVDIAAAQLLVRERGLAVELSGRRRRSTRRRSTSRPFARRGRRLPRLRPPRGAAARRGAAAGSLRLDPERCRYARRDPGGARARHRPRAAQARDRARHGARCPDRRRRRRGHDRADGAGLPAQGELRGAGRTASCGRCDGVERVSLSFDVMTPDEKAALTAKLRGGVTERAARGSPSTRSTRVVAVASGKGGVGKSTLTVNLAAALHASSASGSACSTPTSTATRSPPCSASSQRPVVGRQDDRSAGAGRAQGDVDRVLPGRQRARHVARPDAAPGARAVPLRRPLGRARLAARRHAAWNGRRLDLARPAPAARRGRHRDDAAAAAQEVARAGRRDGAQDGHAPLGAPSRTCRTSIGSGEEIFGSGGGEALARADRHPCSAGATRPTPAGVRRTRASRSWQWIRTARPQW